jgi:hypothetical protein
MRLLVRIVGEGLDEASSHRVRIEVGPRPVEEVPVAEGGSVLPHEEREVGVLPYRAGPLLGRRNPEAVLPPLPLDPLHYWKRFSLPGPGRASEKRGKAAPQEVREEASDEALNSLPVASLPLVRRGIIEQKASGMVIVCGGLDLRPWRRA